MIFIQIEEELNVLHLLNFQKGPNSLEICLRQNLTTFTKFLLTQQRKIACF